MYILSSALHLRLPHQPRSDEEHLTGKRIVSILYGDRTSAECQS